MSARRTGRPRLVADRGVDDPAEQVLRCASELFARKGFASTTTREIAEAVGLQQPSLFYWFPTKWAILDKLIESGIAASAQFAESVGQRPGRALTRLYAVLYFDVRQLCSSPYDLSFLPGAPELRDERLTYRPFLDLLERTVEDLIRASIDEGDVEPIDPTFARLASLGLTSAIMRWRVAPTEVDLTTTATVRFMMRGLACREVDIDQVAAEAAELLTSYSAEAVP